MITVTVQPATPEQFAAVGRLIIDYSKLVAVHVSPTDSVEEQPAAPVKRTRKSAAPADEASAPAPAPIEAPVEAPAPIEAPAPAAEPVKLEQVRARLAELSQAGKTAAIKSLLNQFGAAKLTDLSQDKFADLLTAAEAL